MKNTSLDRTMQFLKDCERDVNKVYVGVLDKYNLFIIENDTGPYIYVEYLAEDIYEDVLFRFNLTKYDYTGYGEFDLFKQLNEFTKDNRHDIINTWNIYNNNHIDEDTDIVVY